MSEPGNVLFTIKHLAGENEIRESFRWVPNMDRVRESSRKGPGKFYKIVAIHPMVTSPNPQPGEHPPRRWTEDELHAAARTLIGKPYNLNHTIPITGGNNLCIDAEYEGDSIEELGYIEDTAIQQGIADRKIRTVSVQGQSREAPIVCTQGGQCAEEPHGTVFNGTALVTDEDFMYNGQLIPADKPGDPRSNIEVLETLKGKSGHSPDTSFSTNTGQSVTEMADSVDSILQAINGLPNLSAETKAKLAESVKGGFGTNAGGAAQGAQLAELATVKGDVDSMKATIAELKGTVSSVQGSVKTLTETLDQKLETTFNKVVNEKLTAFKKENAGQGGAGGNPPGRQGVQTLETLSDPELDTLFLNKLREEPLGSVVEWATRGGK